MRPVNRPAGLRSGFSLVTMSVLLTVAAIVLVSMLPGHEVGNARQKASASVQKLQTVEEGMRGFMAFYGRRLDQLRVPQHRRRRARPHVRGRGMTRTPPFLGRANDGGGRVSSGAR